MEALLLAVAGSPVLRSSAGSFDSALLGGAVVRRLSHDRWRMWYSGRPTNFATDVVPIGSGYIGVAESADGLSWQRVAGDQEHGSVVAPSCARARAFDSTHVGVGDVIPPAGTESVYRMLYFGGDESTPSLGQATLPKGSRMAIGMATSSDGIHWMRQSGLLPSGALVEPSDNQVFVGWPQLLMRTRPSRPRHLLYYHALEDGKFRIHVASSDDLLNWTLHGCCLDVAATAGAFDSRGVSARCVVEDPINPEELLMFYEGQDGSGAHSIGVARGSYDGLQWERHGSDPVFSPSTDASAWDGVAVSRPSLVPLGDGSARLYYLGKSAQGVQAIGVAESQGRDWTSWARVIATSK
ncbi:hypothetical protein AB1Y20_021709 [Prymnesium parvum]|uniref:Glycosyl hydrolase family 32 N-terminal domain-containing protein n=1 Tax=Prymnesium parvum TaxID=97485 RepID=A0AB34JKH0_PRYPA